MLPPNKKIRRYSWLYDRSDAVMAVRDGAGRWPALEAVYNWEPKKKGLDGLLEAFWMNVRSAQALRNRRLIVVSILRETVTKAIKRDGEARILSVACGSAQTVLEAVQGMQNVRILGIDIDPTAIEYSKKLAERYGVEDIKWREGNILSPKSLADEFDPNIIEVVGLFDYLSDKVIVGLLHRLGKMARPGTTLLTAHVHPNSEKFMLHSIVDWDMIYRPRAEFERLMCEGGLEQAHYYAEPHGIFTVACGQLP